LWCRTKKNTGAELPALSAHDCAIEGGGAPAITESTLSTGVKNLKNLNNRKTCGIDPIVGIVGAIEKI
jgi:hypothetical protein